MEKRVVVSLGIAALLLLFGRYILMAVAIGLLFYMDRCGSGDQFKRQGLIPAGAENVYARSETDLHGDGCGLLYYELPSERMAPDSEWRPLTQQARIDLDSTLDDFKAPQNVRPDFNSPGLEYKGNDSRGLSSFETGYRDRVSGRVWHIECSS